MNKIRIGIIGAGYMAQQHLKVAKDIPSIELVGICSRTQSKARALADQFGISACCMDLSSLMKETNPDALLVLVSEDQMVEVVSRALEYGKPLFIEKPAGLIPADNEILAQKAKRLNVKTMVGFNRRYYSIFHQGIEIIKQHGSLLGVSVEGHERFWKILAANKFSRQVLDQWIYANSTHTIDLLRFFGGEINEVKSVKGCFQERKGDQFSVAVSFKDGGIGNYQAFWFSPGGWRVVLYGNGVTVEFKPLEEGRWIDKDFNVHPILPDDLDKKYKSGLYRQMQAFINLVHNGTGQWPMLDLEGAYQTMRLAGQIAGDVR